MTARLWYLQLSVSVFPGKMLVDFLTLTANIRALNWQFEK